MEKHFQQALQECQLLAFDFDGVFTDNKVYINQKGEESVRCDRSDTFGLKELQATGVDVIILSTEPNPIVLHRAKKLNIPARNNLTNKAVALLEEIQQRNLKPNQVIFVGNDINDLPAFKVAGTTIAVANAYPTLKDQADYITKTKGGNGAVREVINLILQAKR